MWPCRRGVVLVKVRIAGIEAATRNRGCGCHRADAIADLDWVCILCDWRQNLERLVANVLDVDMAFGYDRVGESMR